MKYYMLFFSVILSFFTLMPVCVTKLPDKTVQNKNETADSSEAEMYVRVKTDGGIKTMSLDEWTARAVCFEAPENSSEEFCKAMAVAMRTYAAYHLWQNDKTDKHPECDLCSDPMHCKGLSDDISETVSRAVSDTSGELIYCGRFPINPIMHTSSSGMTASAKEYFGIEVEYLQSVTTPNESDLKDFSRAVTFSAEDMAEILSENGYNVTDTPDKWITYIAYTPSGRVRSVSLCGYTISGADIASMLGLVSLNFTIVTTSGKITFETEGIGSGVGMSKYGAYLMGRDGKNYTEILTHYYSGAYIGKHN